ncbi:hypothetical protein CRENBAI_019956 [Crenichthys baileyi]|uniref:Uncharacterized protein n=1 Tax=Crenichthys baileyi TaxID=28760 RepID=A0AAV9QPW2_9TELE
MYIKFDDILFLIYKVKFVKGPTIPNNSNFNYSANTLLQGLGVCSRLDEKTRIAASSVIHPKVFKEVEVGTLCSHVALMGAFICIVGFSHDYRDFVFILCSARILC